MPSDKPKLLFVIKPELLAQVDKYRYENWLPSRAGAVRELIRKGLEQEKKDKPGNEHNPFSSNGA